MTTLAIFNLVLATLMVLILLALPYLGEGASLYVMGVAAMDGLFSITSVGLALWVLQKFWAS